MMSSGNEVLSHNGLIPFETVYAKKEGFLWPIVSGKNLISLFSVPFCFVCNLVQAYNFHVNLGTTWYFFSYKLDNPEISHQLKSPLSFKDIEDKKGND